MNPKRNDYVSSIRVESAWDQRENIVEWLSTNEGLGFSNTHHFIIKIWKDYYVLKKFSSMERAIRWHLQHKTP